jgi:hypothetical protein
MEVVKFGLLGRDWNSQIFLWKICGLYVFELLRL